MDRAFGLKLRAFARRVRWVRAWRGLALGLCVGGGIALAWALLDWRRVVLAEWTWLASVFGASGLLGAAAGAMLPVRSEALARSIDRRAGLEDRLAAASEDRDTEFREAIEGDAAEKLGGLQPAALYPMRFGRWQAAGVILGVLAAGVFLLGNSPVLLDAEAKASRESVQKKAPEIERVLRENIEKPASALSSAEEKRLAEELRRLQKEMERGRIGKEEAMQRQNELAKKADELMRERATLADQSLQRAETAMDKIEKAALEQANLGNVPPEMARMSDRQREAAMKAARQKLDAAKQAMAKAESRLAEIEKKLQDPSLLEAERKALEAERDALKKAQQDARQAAQQAQDALQQLKLSKEAQEVFQRMMQDPAWRELQEMAAKLRKEMQQAQAGERPKLTPEEIEEMRQRMEELAKELSDPEKMREYLEALKEALKNAQACSQCNGVGVGLGSLGLGIGGPAPGPEDDRMNLDTGMINHGAPTPGQGKARPTQTFSQIGDGPGPESYIEIKAPTAVGNRSSVPYREVLPKYRQKAESALRRNQIPSKHQQRVKDYFESLNR